jgi:hypothetical protein
MKTNRIICRWLILILYLLFISPVVLVPLPAFGAWPHLIFPNDDGVTLYKGTEYTIQWGSVRIDPVDILLCREVDPYEIFCFYIIADDVPNSGSYTWTVPNSMDNGSNYLISVGIVGSSVATSDYPFTISDPPSGSWSVGMWGECSVACGGGTQTRDVMCIDSSSGNMIDEIYCLGTKPESTKECNTDPCPIVKMPWMHLLLE